MCIMQNNSQLMLKSYCEIDTATMTKNHFFTHNNSRHTAISSISAVCVSSAASVVVASTAYVQP